MWHASAAYQTMWGPRSGIAIWLVVEDALRGVGARALGEWREQSPKAVHLRRRLTPQEWGEQPWGMDYRGTAEGEQRLTPCRTWLPKGYTE